MPKTPVGRSLAWSLFSQANWFGRFDRRGRGWHRTCINVTYPVVSPTPDQGDYVSVGKYPFVLRLGMPGDLEIVSGLVREAAGWLRTSKNTDQWTKPWPDTAGWIQRS